MKKSRLVILSIALVSAAGALWAVPQFLSETGAHAGALRELQASQAHSPAISLARYISVGTSGAMRQDPVGYWHVMASAVSNADAPIATAGVECTFLDTSGVPIGQGYATFNNIEPGRMIWSNVTLPSVLPPARADCRVTAAYNLD